MRFVRPQEVIEMIGVSRTTLWRMVHAGTFPRPVRITERNCGYVLEAVEAWMKARATGVPLEARGRETARRRVSAARGVVYHGTTQDSHG